MVEKYDRTYSIYEHLEENENDPESNDRLMDELSEKEEKYV